VSQLSRLLDPTVQAKSMEQMIVLLGVLGREVEILVRRPDEVRTA
jgi:hypothetical protein